MASLLSRADSATVSASDLTSSSSSVVEEEEEQWTSEPEWTEEIGPRPGTRGAAGGECASVSSDAKSSDSSEAEDWHDRPGSPDLPPEYWQVQKLVKYIKAGNPTATLISLCALRDLDLDDRYVQLSINDSGGLQVLLNILDTEETSCKIAALLIIRKITSNKHIRKTVFNMRGLDSLIFCLSDYSKQLKLMSAETIANICEIRRARRIMRTTEGISRLVDMLVIEKPPPLHKYQVPYVSADDEGLLEWEVQRCAGIALWAIAKSAKNREAILRAGAVPLLAKLLKTKQDKVVIPIVGVLQECASEPVFRQAIYAEGLLDDFILGLQSPTFELVVYSARAIHMCAHDEKARDVLFQLGAIDKLITIIQDTRCRENKELLAAGTGAIWKCATVICKSEKYLANGLVELLVSFLEPDQPLEVLTNTTGALEEIMKLNPGSSSVVQKVGGITPIIKLLSMGHMELLMNTTRSIGILARDPECRDEMEAQEAFRMIWSLLKHSSPQVQASAAYAICPYVRSSKRAAETVRNYVGGLEVIAELVLSPNIFLQAAVCETIAAIASSIDNLSIMTDHGIVQYLSAICCRTWEHDPLRRSLSKAIGECCKLEGNSRVFGELKAVAPLCSYLTSKEARVVREAAKALAALSEDPRNCVTMHQCGVVPHLLRLIGSADEQLHEAAAVVMSSIRHLALTTETIRLMK